MDNIDVIMAKLDERLSKFSGTEDGVKTEDTKIEADNVDKIDGTEVLESADTSQASSVKPLPEDVPSPQEPKTVIENGGDRKRIRPTADRPASSGLRANGQDKDTFYDNGDVEQEQESASEASNKSQDLASPSSSLDKPNRAPSASSFRSKK